MGKSAKSKSEEITLEVIAEQKKAVLKKIRAEQKVIKQCTGDLFAPVKLTTRADKIVNAVSSGFAVVDGVMFGIRLMKQLRRIFRK
jgi:hypothetical protein